MFHFCSFSVSKLGFSIIYIEYVSIPVGRICGRSLGTSARVSQSDVFTSVARERVASATGLSRILFRVESESTSYLRFYPLLVLVVLRYSTYIEYLVYYLIAQVVSSGSGSLSLECPGSGGALALAPPVGSAKVGTSIH